MFEQLKFFFNLQEVDNLDIQYLVNSFIKNGDVKLENAFSLIA